MSWMQKLCQTYEQCYGNPLFMTGNHVLMPVSHTSQNVNIKVILDKNGTFREAELLGKEPLVIPATEKSAGRTSTAPSPHPLIDKIHYCAGDYTEYGGKKKDNFALYEKLLSAWANSEHSHPKVCAVYAYIAQKRLIHDLVVAKILELDENGKLSKSDSIRQVKLWKYLAKDDSGKKYQGNALVCWSVEGFGPNTDTWNDLELQKAWIAYNATHQESKKVCMITGDSMLAATNHPKYIRKPGDGAKLISSNDESGFTFRGKFDLSDEACTVGYETSHKAHNALRWLIARQGSRQKSKRRAYSKEANYGGQVVIAWAVNGHEIPNPGEDDFLPEPPPGLFVPEVESGIEQCEKIILSHMSDIGQRFSIAVGKALAGYNAKLNPTDEIGLLGLDAATKGRLSVVFYRELRWGNYLGALQGWQEDCKWLMVKKESSPITKKSNPQFFGCLCAPTPAEVALAVYGKYVQEKGKATFTVDSKLVATTRERLLPCIADRFSLPRDLVDNVVRRASNRSGLKKWDWEQILGVACALYRGFYARHTTMEKRRTYAMALESDKKSRDYLYGRLLAVAEHIEYVALRISDEKRPTNAERLMQRFADHPLTTWKTLEEAIQPYRQRLIQRRGPFLTNMDKLLDEIMSLFVADDFATDRPLSGEYLLGYHCQRQALWNKPQDENMKENNEMAEVEE